MKRSNNLYVYLFLTIATIVLLFPIFFKEASFCINHDNLHQAFPFFNKLASSLSHGYFPVWDANTYGGKNFAGEFQSGIFYPLNIIWCILFGSSNGINVYYLDLLIAFHYFICLIGMYQLGKALKFSTPAAIASGLIFTFTGVLSARAAAQTCIFYGLTLLPWAIYFVSKYYFVKKNKRYFIYTGIVGGLQILSGHMQPFFHTILIAGVMIIYYEYLDRKSMKSFILSVLINSSVILLFAIIISLPQLYYSVEYMSRAYRWVGADSPIGPGEKVPFNVYRYKYIFNPSNIFNVFGKDYFKPDENNSIYMGILPLFLFVAYLFRYASLKTTHGYNGLKKVLTIILLVGVLSTLGYLTFFSAILYHIPFVNAVRELSRYGLLINFSAALIVGLAISNINELKSAVFEKSANIKFYLLLALCINGLYLIFFQINYIPHKVSIPFFLGFLFFLILMKSKNTVLVYVLIIAFIFTDLFLNRADYSSTQSAFYPTKFYGRNKIVDFLETTYGKYRVATDFQSEDSLRVNIGDVYKIQTKLGFCATMNKSYFDFISQDWTLNSEVNDLLNIRYVMTDKLLDSNFVFKDSVQSLKLYERRNYYPRVYWKSQTGEPGKKIEEENKTTIKMSDYSDSYQRFEIDCSVADTLILSENNYPGWKCYDNNKRVKIISPVIRNYPLLFRAIAVEKGHHVIEFKYNKVFYWF